MCNITVNGWSWRVAEEGWDGVGEMSPEAAQPVADTGLLGLGIQTTLTVDFAIPLGRFS